jgi:hypothetical protein
VADALGMNRVFIHPLAGVLSAYGMGLADQSLIRERTIEQPLQASQHPAIVRALDELESQARVELAAQYAGQGEMRVERRVRHAAALFLAAQQIGEVGGQELDRAAERGDLVVAGDPHAHFATTSTELADAEPNVGDAAGDAAAEQPAGQRGEHAGEGDQRQGDLPRAPDHRLVGDRTAEILHDADRDQEATDEAGGTGAEGEVARQLAARIAAAFACHGILPEGPGRGASWTLRAELSRWAKKHPDAGSAVSRLSWLECTVRPARQGDQATVAAFDAFLARVGDERPFILAGHSQGSVHLERLLRAVSVALYGRAAA